MSVRSLATKQISLFHTPMTLRTSLRLSLQWFHLWLRLNSFQNEEIQAHEENSLGR